MNMDYIISICGWTAFAIIALLCVVLAYCIGRVVGIAKGFSSAFTMLDNYDTKKGGIYAKASD